jgi:hypothetical protein
VAVSVMVEGNRVTNHQIHCHPTTKDLACAAMKMAILRKVIHPSAQLTVLNLEEDLDV